MGRDTVYAKLRYIVENAEDLHIPTLLTVPVADFELWGPLFTSKITEQPTRIRIRPTDTILAGSVLLAAGSVAPSLPPLPVPLSAVGLQACEFELTNLLTGEEALRLLSALLLGEDLDEVETMISELDADFVINGAGGEPFDDDQYRLTGWHGGDETYDSGI